MYLRLPHLWFECLDRAGILETIAADVASLTKYWSEQDFKKNPQLKKAAAFWKSFDVQQELPIPLLLHGDSASMLVVSIRCVISEKAVKNSELLLACLPKEATTDSTWKPIWDAIATSLTALANRCHPDPSRPLRRAIVMTIAGDLEFTLQNSGGLPRIPTTYARSARQTICMTRTRRLHLSTILDKVQLGGLCHAPPPNNGHQLFAVPAVNCWSLKLDLLRMVDLGCSASCQDTDFAVINDEMTNGWRALQRMPLKPAGLKSICS